MKITKWLSLMFFIILVACGDNNSSISKMTATVTQVIDGDTIKATFENNKEETIRLLLIDTPETVHPTKPVQPFGPEASSPVKSLIPRDTKIKVELGISERDKYGRLLAYVYHNDSMINEILLDKGLARVAYVFPPNTRYIDEFRSIEATAKKEGKGIWSIENYAQEDGFFHDTNKQKADCKIKGNINSDGERIYHTPDSQWYEKTKPEMWFCTEQEAIEAGFRAPR